MALQILQKHTRKGKKWHSTHVILGQDGVRRYKFRIMHYHADIDLKAVIAETLSYTEAWRMTKRGYEMVYAVQEQAQVRVFIVDLQPADAEPEQVDPPQRPAPQPEKTDKPNPPEHQEPPAPPTPPGDDQDDGDEGFDIDKLFS